MGMDIAVLGVDLRKNVCSVVGPSIFIAASSSGFSGVAPACPGRRKEPDSGHAYFQCVGPIKLRTRAVNASAKRFRWIKSVDDISAAIKRFCSITLSTT